MPGIILDATISYLDADDLDRVVNEFVRVEMSRSIRQFLKACLARIPVRTGFLKGSFTEIVQAFASENAEAIPEIINSAVSASKNTHAVRTGNLSPQEEHFLVSHGRGRNLRVDKALRRLANVQGSVKGEYYYGAGGKLLKTPSSGIPFATKPQEVLKISNGKAQFNLQVNIDYYRVNDFSARIRGGPWESLDAGLVAMVNYLEQAGNRFPPFTDLLGKIRFQVRGVQLSKTTQKADIDGVLRSRYFK